MNTALTKLLTVQELAVIAVKAFSSRTYGSEQDAQDDLRHLIVLACCQAQLNALDQFTATLADLARP